MTMTRTSALRLGLLVALGGCKLEPIEDLELDRDPAPALPDRVVPLSSERIGGDIDERWDASLKSYISFLTSPTLSGRRPGTEGGKLTEGFVISVLQAAGVSPNGPDLGWTQPVGIRVVQTEDVVLTVAPAAPTPAEGTKDVVDSEPPPPQRFEEGLWLRHRGAAGPLTLTLRLGEAAPAVAPEASPEVTPSPDGEKPAAASAPDLMEALPPIAVVEGASIDDTFREAFDAAWRNGAEVAVLPTPTEGQPELRNAASAWQRPEIQTLLLGRDPPAGLDLEGFVAPEVYEVLLLAQARPGSTAELEYLAEERWFQDANIIGRIAGDRRPEQAVVLVAHWDAGGLSAPDAEGATSIANASGLAVMLAVAEASGRWLEAGRRPDRSLVFVATAAGTLGHRGATRFLEASGIRPANIVAVINLERLGGTESDLLVIDGERSSLLGNVAALEPTARAVEDRGRTHGHRPFLEQRVPAVSLSRPSLVLEDGTEPEPSLPTLRNDAELTFRLIWELSDRADLPRLLEPDAPPPEDSGPADPVEPSPAPQPTE
ncbi:MAG: M28 family peptidase [Nannocystaceae bacterium]